MEDNQNNTPPLVTDDKPSKARIWNFAVAIVLIVLGGNYLRDSSLIDAYHFKAISSLVLGIVLLAINIKYKK
jgi:hypothetical protein